MSGNDSEKGLAVAVLVGTADDLRRQAMALLERAYQMDGKRPFQVAYEADHGTYAYTVWAGPDAAPTRESEMANICESDACTPEEVTDVNIVELSVSTLLSLDSEVFGDEVLADDDGSDQGDGHAAPRG